MPIGARTLSKSDYKIARQCDAKLFFRENGYPDNTGMNDYLKLLAYGGYMVDALACARRPDGIALEYGRNHAADFATTMEHLARDDVTLFQATLLWNRRLARADILEKRGNAIRLLEVKTGSIAGDEHADSVAKGGRGSMRGVKSPYHIRNEWKEYLEDVTYQTILLERLLPDAAVTPWLVLVDTSRRSGIDDVPSLFDIERGGRDGAGVRSMRFTGTRDQLAELDILLEVDVSEEVAMLRGDVDSAASVFESMLDEPFDRSWAHHGSKCGSCEFRVGSGVEPNGFEECWGDLALARPHALELFSIGTAKSPDRGPLVEYLVSTGKASLLDIPEAGLRTAKGEIGATAARQLRQIEHTRSGDIWIGPQLRDQVAALSYPLYFIDFEVSRIALPYHAGMRPYGPVAFQWSCHVVDAPGSTPRHSEWLNTESTWPNLTFARTLRDALGDAGSVLTWTAFEASQLKDIAAEHPRFEALDSGLVDWIRDLIGTRFFDLHKCARDQFYHPGMKGRTSIKVVLDAVWKTDPIMREQFLQWTGRRVSASEDPYKALPPLVIAGVEQSVHEGTGAVRAYEAMMYGAERRDERARAQWRELLLQYCALDTLSMVLVFEHWRRTTGIA